MASVGKDSIIVVDDDSLSLHAVKLLLEAGGYHVLSFNDPAKALQMIRTERVEVVLSDVRMPRMSGMELIHAIHNLDPEMPVLLMTAYAELEMAVDAIKQGAFDFLIKPFTPDQMYHAVNKAITYHRLIEMEKNYKTTLEDTVRIRT